MRELLRLIGAGYVVLLGLAALAKLDAWSAWKQAVRLWAPGPVPPSLIVAGLPAMEVATGILLLLNVGLGFVVSGFLLLVL